MRSRSTMKSEEAVMPDAKKPDQSVGRGVKTTLSPSRRMNTSRTESGNRYSRGMVTVCERLFHPTRAVGLGVGVWCIAMYPSIWHELPYGKSYAKWRPKCGGDHALLPSNVKTLRFAVAFGNGTPSCWAVSHGPGDGSSDRTGALPPSRLDGYAPGFRLGGSSACYCGGSAGSFVASRFGSCASL